MWPASNHNQLTNRMKEYALLFRMDITTPEKQPSQEQMVTYMQQWMEWVQYIDSKGQLSEGGNHFSKAGRVLKPNQSVTEGPHVSENNSVAGYLIVTAKDLNDATALAEKCPILKGENTSVEIRELGTLG